MIVIKRDGREVPFDKEKIKTAIGKAFKEVEFDCDSEVLSTAVDEITEMLYRDYSDKISIENIQDCVEFFLMKFNPVAAKAYITYRYRQAIKRQIHSTDEEVLSLIDCKNEEVKEENSNKNPTLVPTQRDYMAGAVSKDLTNRILLPEDIVNAHKEGIIHFHDTDYYAQYMHNCDLVNLEDMLQNGTVISGTMIEKPRSFTTACTIATQIIAQVASNQYGGQSISVAHLAPFVQISREVIREKVRKDFELIRQSIREEEINAITEKRLREEIKSGVQTIQYQIVTLMTTNGQSPFVTLFMYLGEAKNEQEKHDLALIIEEMLLQRYQGVKNEKGVWITPAFPKLIYVLEEDNIRPESEYYYLTEFAAKCTAKRLVPDYISEKVMKELKEGNCFPVMG